MWEGNLLSLCSVYFQEFQEMLQWQSVFYNASYE